MPLILWFAGLVGLVVAATLASAKARARPDDIVGRAVFVAAGLAYAVVVGSVVWVWGGASASEARRARIAEGASVVLELAHERKVVRAGDVLVVGEHVALPGVVGWEPRAARGRTVVAVPADPTACEAWVPVARRDGAWCELGTSELAIRALPLVPEPARVVGRGARAAIAIGAPLVLAFGVLAMLPRGRRRARVLGDTMALAAIAGGLAALVAWRLYWAYRIDVLRELAPDGARLALNQFGAVAIGAAIAGLAAFRRPLLAIAAWLGWLAIAWATCAREHALDAAHVPIVAMSLAIVLLPIVGARARRHALLRTPELALVAIGAAAFVGRTAAPRFVLGKLGLAFALVLAGYAGLRVALARDTGWQRRGWLVAALLAAGFAVARYDAGVALAIGGTGLAIAMLVAGHDAAYDASQGCRLGVLEREHARLVAVHASAAALLAIGLATAAWLASAQTLLARGALVATHAPLAAALLFAIGAIVARSHRRGWLPWLAATLACLALWSVRARLVDRVTGGDGIGAHRIAAVVDPGYALLADERAFAANASAWRESELPAGSDVDPFTGQGYFGARIRDPGVARSLDNDYLPILVAREGGIAGLLQGAALLLAIAIGAACLAGARLRHASAAHRARALLAATACLLVVYQPLAALGVLPLTGISWPGLGVDSPADLWLFVAGATWIALGTPVADATAAAAHDESVRRTPRVARARRLAIAALAITGVAAITIVARAGACALARVATDDARVDAAMRYAGSLACPWREHTDVDVDVDGLVPRADALASAPEDVATTRFDRELRARWTRERAAVVAHLAACRDAAPRTACTARVVAGWPAITITLASPTTATCTIEHTDDAIAALRAHDRVLARTPRIRVVAPALGVTTADVGELVAGGRVVRLRPNAARAAWATAPAAAGEVTLGAATLVATPAGVRLRGAATVFVAAAGTWRPLPRGLDETLLDRTALVVAGDDVVELRVGSDQLLADDGDPTATTARRVYPYGAALPELGWVNRYDVARSYGLDGWIHAALAHPSTVSQACGSLAPPTIDRARTCTPDPDGTLACRVALQPALVAGLRAVATRALVDAHAVRAGFVVLRGDTGELLAQGQLSPDRGALAFAPNGVAAEAALVKLLDTPGEGPGERAEWNAPIAAGSTMKPILARAAEQAFPAELARLSLSASEHAPRCPSRHGRSIDPIYGHCPPTTVAGNPSTADVHDFLAYSPNWFEAALGIAGLGLGPTATMTIDRHPITASQLLARDVASIPTRTPLEIADADGPILTRRAIVVAGLRRTPLWQRAEAILGRPLCTHCARAAERADTCAARALPIANPSPALRALVALGPDRIELPDGPATEYFQLLRGSGVHPLGSLAQLTDAFGRIVYDPTPAPAAPRLAASWFPAPVVGVVPPYACGAAGRASSVLGPDGGLCAVVRPGGTAYAGVKDVLADPRVAIYGAKTGTSDSLADVARSPSACRAWNATHVAATQLACGNVTAPLDDSLLVIAFGITTPKGIVPITLGLQLQRGGKGSAARAAPSFIRAIADFLTD